MVLTVQLPGILRRCLLVLILPMVAVAASGCSPEPAETTVESGDADPSPDAALLNQVAAPDALALETEQVTLADGRTIELEIGYMTVPENRSAPGRAIQVEVARVRRQDSADPGTPPVFFLPGGPGFPGARFMLDRDSMPQIVDMFTPLTDLVIVSQRGIGSSIPSLACEVDFVPDLGSAEALEALDEAVIEAAGNCRQHWLTQGVDLPAYSVPEAATDVRDIAAAMGYETITLWGVSFGSHWSMAIMRFHPEIVARAVLGGLEGPDHTYDMPSGVLSAVRRMALEASESPALAAFTPDGGWLAAFKGLIGELNESPVVVTVDGRDVYVDGEGIKAAALGYSRGISSRSGMRHWPSDISRLLAGDYQGFAEAMLGQVSRGLPPAAFFTLDCGSGITAERKAELDRDPGQAMLGNLSSFYEDVCPVWQVDLTDAFRTGFSTEIPSLLVHGTYDVSTPYSNARELLPAFSNHAFVTVDGGSHGALQEALGADPAFAQNTLRFILTGELTGFPERIELEPIDWIVPGG